MSHAADPSANTRPVDAHDAPRGFWRELGEIVVLCGAYSGMAVLALGAYVLTLS